MHPHLSEKLGANIHFIMFKHLLPSFSFFKGRRMSMFSRNMHINANINIGTANCLSDLRFSNELKLMIFLKIYPFIDAGWSDCLLKFLLSC